MMAMAHTRWGYIMWMWGSLNFNYIPIQMSEEHFQLKTLYSPLYIAPKHSRFRVIIRMQFWCHPTDTCKRYTRSTVHIHTYIQADICSFFEWVGPVAVDLPLFQDYAIRLLTRWKDILLNGSSNGVYSTSITAQACIMAHNPNRHTKCICNMNVTSVAI